MLRIGSFRFKHYVLTYKYVEGMEQKRMPYREQHLKMLQKWEQEGHLLIGGALQNPIDKGMLLFEVPKEELVHQFVQSDPYYTNKLLLEYNVREINIVVGSLKRHLLD